MSVLRVASLTHNLVRYLPCLQLQQELVRQRALDTIPDTLLVVQHAPVFTIGKRGSTSDFYTDIQALVDSGVDVATVPRGGETTFHGPGQLVAYPIINLRQLHLGARAFVEGLEDAMIAAVGCFGLQAYGRVQGKTGVWVGERKIGAVGVRITHGISSHGIALNICTDLGYYKHIVPCGTPDKDVTSVQNELLLLRQRRHCLNPEAGHTNTQAGNSSSSSCGGGGGGDLMHAPLVGLADAEQHLVRSLGRVFGFALSPSATELHQQQQDSAAAAAAGGGGCVTKGDKGKQCAQYLLKAGTPEEKHLLHCYEMLFV